MKYMELIAPCHFGMEAVLKREILDLGYEISKVEDGKVTFLADAEGIAQANMFLRTTERILLKTGEFKAVTFDELLKNKGNPMGRVYSEGRKVLGCQSKLCKERIIQSVRYSVDHEESNRRTTEKRLRNFLVPGGGCKLPDPCSVYERCGDDRN